MDLKEHESAGISLDFSGEEDQHHFVGFNGNDGEGLVIQQVGQLSIPTGGLTIHPPASTSRSKSNVQNGVGGTTVPPKDGPSQMTATETTDSILEGSSSKEQQQFFRDLKKKKFEMNVNQSWFTGKHAKESLQEQGHSWKQGMWSKEEVSILMKNIEDYVKSKDLKDPMQVIFQLRKEDRKDFYRTIASGLNRPLFAVYRRVQRMYDSKNYVGKYSAADIERLKSLRATLGNDWAQIGAKMGRSASSVKDKCRLLKETCQQGKWRFDEEERLTAAVYDVTKTSPGESITGGIPWQQVALKVVTRTEKQCRAKWLNYLNWKHTGGTEWDKNDDERLLEKMKTFQGKDEQSIPWQQLAKDWKSVRSPQWLRSKWWSLKRTVPNYDMYTIPDLVDVLRKAQQKQKLRFDVFPCGMGLPAFKIARLEVPPDGAAKNGTVTLHLPLPIRSGDTTITTANVPVKCATSQLGVLTETLMSSRDPPGTSSGPLLLQQGTLLDDHRIILQSIGSAGPLGENSQIVVQGAQQSEPRTYLVRAVDPEEGMADTQQILIQSLEGAGDVSDPQQIVVQAMDPPGSISDTQHIMVQSMDSTPGTVPDMQRIMLQSMNSPGGISDTQQIMVRSMDAPGNISDTQQIMVQSMDSPGDIPDTSQIMVQPMNSPVSISNSQEIMVRSMDSPGGIPDGTNQIAVQSMEVNGSISDDDRMIRQSLEHCGTISDNPRIVVDSMEQQEAMLDGQQIMVSEMESSGAISDSPEMVVSSLQDEEISPSTCTQQLRLESGSPDHLIITTNNGEDDVSHDLGADEVAMDVRVSLSDSQLAVVSDASHPLAQSEVDRLTSEMNQSDHTDGMEDSHLNSQSQLIGTDAVLSSQQEVTSSELQVVPDSSIHEEEKSLVSERSTPPSEGLMVQPGGHDNSHLENSVFTLSGSLLSCHSDHSYLMEPPPEIQGGTKLPISSHS